MRKFKTFSLLVAALFLLSFSQVAAQEWLVYNADVLPAETGTGINTLDLTNVADDSPGAGFIQEIIDDTDIAGNKILKYLQPDGKTMYRYYFDDEYADTMFTIMARIKAEADTNYDRAFDIRWDNANAGTRDELRIWAQDSTLELEKADLKVKVDMDLTQWHTYRIVVNGDIASLYIDENKVAVVTGTTDASTSNKYMKVGDGSGDAIGGYVDWLILDVTGAYAPGEGAPVPAGLFVDGGPRWLVYDGSILPEATEDAGGDTLDISNLADDSPGAGMVKEVVDDEDIPGNKLFKYLQPDGKQMFRHYFDDEYADSMFTIMARIKAEPDTNYDRAFDIRWDNANAGTRDELRIWAQDSTVELEKADLKVQVNMDLTQWHTYRIVVDGDAATLYIDEAEIVTGITDASTSNKYIKVGDGSGDAIGGYVDWLILDKSGAYGPGEGLPVPEGLHVDYSPNASRWLVYDASVLPVDTEDAGGDTLDLHDFSQDSPGADFVELIIDDPDIPGNSLLEYLQPDGTRMYRYKFVDGYTSESLTMIARIKGAVDTTYDRVFDLQWRNANAGTRDELRIWGHDGSLELEKAGTEATVGNDLFSWNTYRIAVSGDTAKVYLNENPLPVIEGVSTASTSDAYIKIGDGSGDAIGGYLDWCIVDLSGAYAPGEGLPIPQGLKVDMDPVAVNENSELPTQYMLSQNYPNPFNPTTKIRYQIPKASRVQITVYNILGQVVANLVDKEMTAGSHEISFKGINFASGVYFYSIKAGDFVDVKKMMLLK